jgi:3',5'-cyclic AMP phosphodiesterase CpdA
MALLVHLSDLHMAPDLPAQSAIFDALVRTLRVERQDRPTEPVAIVVTGDVFDSAERPARKAAEAFLRLHGRMVEALGGEALTIVLPGNHDRRRFGLLAPHRRRLFQALHDAADPARLFVAGCEQPFLAQVVPEALHRLPVHVIAYDSTYLPGGLVGAGGTLRLEDLLMASARLPDDGRAVLILTHHHLIPTPLTDVSHIDSAGTNRVARWVVRTVLPTLVSYGDREELTMTALGAGTALTTLHTFGRAVLLLHGHKHVPTARLVAGMSDGCGDVLIASAGSAGTRERVHESRHPDAARLWPSFNLVHLSADQVRIEALAFSPKPSARPALRRELANARVVRTKWAPEPVSFRVHDPAPRVEVDEASYRLTPSSSAGYWDYACERRVELRNGALLKRYVDYVRKTPTRIGPQSLLRDRRPLELTIDGVTSYERPAALCRTLAAASRARGHGTAFEWVALLSRYGAVRATLRLSRADCGGLEPFGSLTDLTIGRERPVKLETTADYWTVTAESCAPRSMLRIYWPLGRARAEGSPLT